jgi:hypothetical protein
MLDFNFTRLALIVRSLLLHSFDLQQILNSILKSLYSGFSFDIPISTAS